MMASAVKTTVPEIATRMMETSAVRRFVNWGVNISQGNFGRDLEKIAARGNRSSPILGLVAAPSPSRQK